jgi:hypothetical protein
MQNKLIEENKALKQFEDKATAALKEMKTILIYSGRSEANLKISSLIDSLIH